MRRLLHSRTEKRSPSGHLDDSTALSLTSTRVAGNAAQVPMNLGHNLETAPVRNEVTQRRSEPQLVREIEEEGKQQDLIRAFPESRASGDPAKIGANATGLWRSTRSTLIQLSLKVGKAGDAYEQEAERVAQAVMHSTTSPEVGSAGAGSISRISESDAPSVERLLDRAQNDTDSTQLSEEVASRIRAGEGVGSALPQPVRQTMERQIGHDFSRVKVRADSDAADLCQRLGAKAFTHQSTIWLGRGTQAQDVRLMAHELTHVVQQGAAAPLASSPANDLSRPSDMQMVQMQGGGNAPVNTPIVYPDISTIIQSPAVVSARAADWNAGTADYYERSGWITWNPTGNPITAFAVVNRQVGDDDGVDPGPKPADTPTAKCVGHYHTHPPLAPGRNPLLYPVGPSGADRNFANANNNPGVVQDFTNRSRTATTDYFYGPSRRA